MPIRFGTYNISNGRNRGLDLALRGMSQANMELGIFQEKNLPMASTTLGRPGTASSQQTLRAGTAAGLQSSIGRHCALRWSLSIS